MKDKLNLLSAKKIHFIGVGGVSMSGLARYLLSCGKVVSGSDNRMSETVKKLKDLGVLVHIGHSASFVKDVDLVVVTSAISDDNEELLAAQNRKIKVIKRSELLGEIIKGYKKSIAVSGCHGKTTATAMIAHVLDRAGKDPTVFVGGEDFRFGNFRKGKDDFVVVEACEYKKNFLDIKADMSVVLNIDDDHGDSYINMDDMTDAFREFSKNSMLITNADDEKAEKLFNSTTLSFGMEKTANYYAKNVKKNGRGYSFTACAYSMPYGRIELSIPGRHNVYNALVAFAVGDVLKIPFIKIKSALEEFASVKRRNEYLGSLFSLRAFADYAHHPKEIDATLSAFLEDGDDLVVVFQPHTYSRTKLLFKDFIRVLGRHDKLIIYKTYAAREKFDEKASAMSLCSAIKLEENKAVCYAENPTQLKCLIKEMAKDKKRVIFLGAGDIYEVAKNLITDSEGDKKR